MKKLLNNIRANYKLVLGVLIIGFVLGWLIFDDSGGDEGIAGSVISHNGHEHQEEAPATWTCSMHPQIKQDEPGDCPICGMDLVPLSSMGDSESGADTDEIVLSESAAKLAEIQTTKVKKGTPEKTIFLQGKVATDERNIAEFTARFSGRIEKLFVNFTGQQVNKGEKLATIYSPDLLTAQQELLEAAKLKEHRPSIYNAARAKLSLWDLTDDQIAMIEEKAEPIKYFDVLSPISGTIMNRYVEHGGYVRAGDELFRITDLTKVWVMFDAYESDLPWISTGDKVRFTVQSLPGKTYEARVKYIDPYINPETRSVKVRIEVLNPDMELKPEMFARGRIHSTFAEKNDQILIPKSAVLWTGKRSVVYVKNPERELNAFEYREITLGPEAGENYVIAGGLEEGEIIATNGVFKIDAAAQLEGKPSMMNPKGGQSGTGHDHSGMDMKTSEQEEEKDATPVMEHAMVKVYGNCVMCKDRIEEAANNLEGVVSAVWDMDTKMLHLEYDPSEVKVIEVEEAIAAVGHDTENQRAPDEVYDELPGCCLFDRPDNN